MRGNNRFLSDLELERIVALLSSSDKPASETSGRLRVRVGKRLRETPKPAGGSLLHRDITTSSSIETTTGYRPGRA